MGLWDIFTHCSVATTNHDYAETLYVCYSSWKTVVLKVIMTESNFAVADGRWRRNRSNEGADWWRTATNQCCIEQYELTDWSAQSYCAEMHHLANSRLCTVLVYSGFPLVLKSLEKCLNFTHSNSRPLKVLKMIMVLKSPWKVLKFCYRIFEFFGNRARPGFNQDHSESFC